MPRGPPCGHLACPEPQNSGGQWYYLPRGHGKRITPGANSVCKRPDCRRYFKMLGEKGKPGPKKAGDATSGNERTMPAKYILKKVHDIIGCRCARRACPLRSPPCRVNALTDCFVRVGRIANISQLDAEERAGNPLKSTVLEYAVRGHFLMSKTDQYGQHTTYYVPHKTMLRDLDNLPTELEIFEGNVALHRQMEEGEFGEEGEDGEEGEGEEWGEEDERL